MAVSLGDKVFARVNADKYYGIVVRLRPDYKCDIDLDVGGGLMYVDIDKCEPIQKEPEDYTDSDGRIWYRPNVFAWAAVNMALHEMREWINSVDAKCDQCGSKMVFGKPEDHAADCYRGTRGLDK